MWMLNKPSAFEFDVSLTQNQEVILCMLVLIMLQEMRNMKQNEKQWNIKSHYNSPQSLNQIKVSHIHVIIYSRTLGI